MAFDPTAIRQQFPFLQAKKGEQPIVYLDSAATAQKPSCVIDAVAETMRTATGGVHRGMHPLSERATHLYENARTTVATFLHADRQEIIFTKNTTESINLVAQSFGRSMLQKDDIVILTMLEHHSNSVPWLQLQEEKGIHIRWIDIDEHGHLRMDQMEEALQHPKSKLLAITGQSNVLGVQPDLKAILSLAKKHHVYTVVDAAQMIVHTVVDVRALDCDFLAFSGHKLYGPDGIGVLYGKKDLLMKMPPFLGGGSMIQTVTMEGFTPDEPPHRFEAGTPPAAEAHGLATAIDWITNIDLNDRITYEQKLLTHAITQLKIIQGLKILGLASADAQTGLVSFTIDGIHPHDLTDLLGQENICVRAGHHCAAPLHKRLGITSSTRLSLGLYNTMEEIDVCIDAIKKILQSFL